MNNAMMILGFVLLVVGVVALTGCMTPQDRMKYCNETAGSLKGDARQAHMKECLRF